MRRDGRKLTLGSISIQFITNPQVTQGTFYIGNEHTHSMIMHRI
jgi:hypothetical protein